MDSPQATQETFNVRRVGSNHDPGMLPYFAWGPLAQRPGAPLPGLAGKPFLGAHGAPRWDQRFPKTTGISQREPATVATATCVGSVAAGPPLPPRRPFHCQ